MRESWKIKKLGDVGKVSMCKRIYKKQTSSSGDIPFYKIGTFGKQPDAFISEELYNEYRIKYSYPKKGEVLLSASGTIGRTVVFDGEPAYFQDSNIVWISHDESEVLNEYLLKFYGYCDWNPSKGATISRLYNDDLRSIQIPIPPFKEQKQIVSILDKAFVAIDQAKANIEKNIQNAEELFQSYKENLIDNYAEKSFVELNSVVKLTRGHNPPKKDFMYEPKEGYVRFYQIRDGWSDKHKVYVPDTEKLHRVSEDEILMVAYRHIGRVFRGVNGAFNVALCKISNRDTSRLNNDYLFELIPSKYIRGELLKMSERSLIPSMSVKKLEKLKVPMPELLYQSEVVSKLNELRSNYESIKQRYFLKSKSLNELRSSILQKAFSGELTSSKEIVKQAESTV